MEWKLTQIPKHAHFYWHTEVMPWVRYLALETFRKHHPDWKITLYRGPELTAYPEKDQHIENWWGKAHALVDEVKIIDIDKEIGRDLTFIYQPKLDVHRSDFFYMYILSTVGGLWLNMDMLFFKPIESMYFNSEDNATYELLCMEKNYNNMILAAKGSSTMKALLKDTVEKSEASILKSFASTGPMPFEKMKGNIKRLSKDLTEYMVDETKYYREGEIHSIPSHVFAIHYHGSGQHTTHAHLTPKNYLYDKSDPNSITFAKLVALALGEPYGKLPGKTPEALLHVAEPNAVLLVRSAINLIDHNERRENLHKFLDMYLNNATEENKTIFFQEVEKVVNRSKADKVRSEFFKMFVDK